MASRSARRAPAEPASVRAKPSASRRRGSQAPPDDDHGTPSTTLRDILNAAGELLDERGMDGLNTTAIAQRAGISTATLYRHFPDKHAVLHALVHDLQEERAAAVTGLYERIARESDWRTPLREATRTLYRMRLARPGGRSTRRALQTSPELWQWDLQQNEEVARALARAIRRRAPSPTRAAAERIALTTVTASIALLDLACLDDRRGPALVEAGIAMREAFLATFLD